MKFSDFPRVDLVHAPTPLERLANLTNQVGGPNLFVKRDDCTGFAGGGNKARKLEYLMAEALAGGADTVVTHGAVQSNHVRQTAAAAARLGLACEALLEERVATTDPDYLQSGNVLLDRLFGARLHRCASGRDMNRACEEFADQLRDRGRKVYVIPGGGSNPLGALGYVACAREMLAQASEQGFHIDHVVHATGSTGTQAGLIAGFLETGVSVLGISVRQPRQKQEAAVLDLAQRTAALVESPHAVSADAVAVSDACVGPGYGQVSHEMIEAVRMVARVEGLLLDPVYTGKGMAGLLRCIKEGRFGPGENVVFLHTGGAIGLFGYRSAILNSAPEGRSPTSAGSA